MSEVDKFTIILPWPPKELKANSGAPMGLKFKAKEFYRELAFTYVHNAWVASPCMRRPRWKQACYSLKALCGKKHQRGGRLNRPDEDNFIASLKMALDALEKVGIIANDRGLSIAGPVEWIRTEAKESLIELAVWNNSPEKSTTKPAGN